MFAKNFRPPEVRLLRKVRRLALMEVSLPSSDIPSGGTDKPLSATALSLGVHLDSLLLVFEKWTLQSSVWLQSLERQLYQLQLLVHV